MFYYAIFHIDKKQFFKEIKRKNSFSETSVSLFASSSGEETENDLPRGISGWYLIEKQKKFLINKKNKG